MRVLKGLLIVASFLSVSKVATAAPNCVDQVRTAFEQQAGDTVSIKPISLDQALAELINSSDWRAKLEIEMIQNIFHEDVSASIYRVNLEFDYEKNRYSQDFLSVRNGDCKNHGRLILNDESPIKKQ